MSGQDWTFADPEIVCRPPVTPLARGPRNLCRAMLVDALRLARTTQRGLTLAAKDRDALRYWVLAEDTVLSFPTCCQALGLAVDPVRRQLLRLLDATPATQTTFPVLAACVPHPPRIRPGWIQCPKCRRIAPVRDTIRTTLCAPCGRRTTGYYVRRQLRRERTRVAQVA